MTRDQIIADELRIALVKLDVLASDYGGSDRQLPLYRSIAKAAAEDIRARLLACGVMGFK